MRFIKATSDATLNTSNDGVSTSFQGKPKSYNTDLINTSTCQCCLASAKYDESSLAAVLSTVCQGSEDKH